MYHCTTPLCFLEVIERSHHTIATPLLLFGIMSEIAPHHRHGATFPLGIVSARKRVCRCGRQNFMLLLAFRFGLMKRSHPHHRHTSLPSSSGNGFRYHSTQRRARLTNLEIRPHHRHTTLFFKSIRKRYSAKKSTVPVRKLLWRCQFL